MDLISILATVILATTIATVLMGFVAYTAFKMREKRRPRSGSLRSAEQLESGNPIFFTRYQPDGDASYTPAPQVRVGALRQ